MFGEDIFTVKQYLPIQKKMEIIQDVVQAAFNNNPNYANPGLLSVYFWIEVVQNYTDIEIPEGIDYSDAYDALRGSGLLAEIEAEIPSTEYLSLVKYLEDTISRFYQYNNSAAGIIANMTQNSEDLEAITETIKQNIGDEDNLGFLKDVLSKLG